MSRFNHLGVKPFHGADPDAVSNRASRVRPYPDETVSEPLIVSHYENNTAEQ